MTESNSGALASFSRGASRRDENKGVRFVHARRKKTSLILFTDTKVFSLEQGECRMKLSYLAAIAFVPVMLAGCFNLPTQPSQISGAYVNSLKYEQFDCDRLSAEADSLSRRESQLVIAQEQRLKSSKVQAFWLGYGQGDGIEASELANVRGEREAVRKAMDVKNCIGATVTPQDQMQYKPKF